MTSLSYAGTFLFHSSDFWRSFYFIFALFPWQVPSPLICKHREGGKARPGGPAAGNYWGVFLLVPGILYYGPKWGGGLRLLLFSCSRNAAAALICVPLCWQGFYRSPTFGPLLTRCHLILIRMLSACYFICRYDTKPRQSRAKPPTQAGRNQEIQ